MNYFNNFDYASPLSIAIIFVWSMFWKGVSLWRASKENQRNWFIALLLINTIGILEIIYLFRFAKRRLTLKELKSWIKTK